MHMAAVWRCFSRAVQRPAARSLLWTQVGRISSTVDEVPIPEYTPRNGEEDGIKRRRLLYQSRKRGMLENGLLLSTFAERYLETLTPQQLCEYDSLINKPSNDWDIYYWATGKEPVPPEYSSSVMNLLQEHATNDQRETRITQPDLYNSEK